MTTTGRVTLVVSDTWVRSHQDGGEAAARIGALRDAVEGLRSDTHTGWVGRQDDVTGFLAELSGGSWHGQPGGVPRRARPGPVRRRTPPPLQLGDADTETVPNVTTTRATQALGGVPVLDASLVFTGRGSPASTDDQRVTGVLGRVFPGLTVDTTPTISAEQATTTAAEAAGGTTDGTARLVVLPNGTGVLAWEVVVVGATPEDLQAGRYYIDAHTGDLVDVRPVSAEVLPPVPSPRGGSGQGTGQRTRAAACRRRTPTASRSPAPTRSDATSRRSASRTATASS